MKNVNINSIASYPLPKIRTRFFLKIMIFVCDISEKKRTTCNFFLYLNAQNIYCIECTFSGCFGKTNWKYYLNFHTRKVLNFQTSPQKYLSFLSSKFCCFQNKCKYNTVYLKLVAFSQKVLNIFAK